MENQENIYYTYFMSLNCYFMAMEAMKNGELKRAEVYIRNGKIFSLLLMTTIKSIYHESN